MPPKEVHEFAVRVLLETEFIYHLHAENAEQAREFAVSRAKDASAFDLVQRRQTILVTHGVEPGYRIPAAEVATYTGDRDITERGIPMRYFRAYNIKGEWYWSEGPKDEYDLKHVALWEPDSNYLAFLEALAAFPGSEYRKVQLQALVDQGIGKAS